MSKTRFAIPAALALAAVLGTGVAHARDADVHWSVTIGNPVHSMPLPVYRPYPPAYAAVRYHAPTHWDRDGDGIPNRHDRLYNPAWDVDGDGIPNRHDRRYNPARDVDGDGIPNRRDGRYSPHRDHDRDDVRNRYDRHDDNPWRR